MTPRYSFVVCKASGEAIGEALSAKRRTLTRTLNAPAVAQLDLQLGDGLAAQITPGTSRLKIYRAATPAEVQSGIGKTLVFYGSLPSTGLTLTASTDTLSAVYQDPRWIFARRFAMGTETFTATNQGAIIHGLLAAQEARSEGATFMIAGAVSTSVQRDRTFSRQQLDQLIDDLTKVVNGCDVDCGPYDGYTLTGARTMGQLNTYDRQGTDRPNAVFAYGPGTLANVNDATLSYADITSIATVTGNDAAGAPVSSTYNNASAAGVGMLEQLEADPDVSLQATVDSKARGIVTERGRLREIITITDPLPDAPRAFVDYLIGDTVRVQIKRGAFTYTGSPRVMQIAMDIDQEGYERVSLVFA